MDRNWFLTWTTYGSWLSGDARGFVSNVADEHGNGVRHNASRTPCDADLPALQKYMRDQLVGDPIYLAAEHAVVLLDQFQETAQVRGWLLMAVAIMANHIHILVAVPGDPEPDSLLRDFKSYGSRALNRRWGKPPSGTWWTESGSKRKKSDDTAIQNALQYVKDQANPLLIWTHHEASGGRQPPVEESKNESTNK